jgi:hypothetical protein
VSARPDIPRLAEEDLDLLISRSLDGDLSPEEEQQLERLVALDPAAARRKAELAALVADVKALPEPATPFALATRVNANVSERGGRPSSLGGRVGFFPAPGFAKIALVILGIVGVSIAVLRPVPKRLVEGPVDVILYNPPPAVPAPQSVIAESRPEKSQARLDERARARRQEADGPRNEESADKVGALKKSVKSEEVLQNATAASSEILSAEGAPKKQAAKEDRGDLDAAVASQAPAKIAAASAAPAAAGGRDRAAAAPAPVAVPATNEAPAAGTASRVPRGWTVSVRGDAARRWSLRRAPDDPPSARGAAVYHVTLDASGRVTTLHRVGVGPANPRLDAFVRGMVFEPRAPTAEAESRSGGKDESGSFADFEVELASR